MASSKAVHRPKPLVQRAVRAGIAPIPAAQAPAAGPDLSAAAFTIKDLEGIATLAKRAPLRDMNEAQAASVALTRLVNYVQAKLAADAAKV